MRLSWKSNVAYLLSARDALSLFYYGGGSYVVSRIPRFFVWASTVKRAYHLLLGGQRVGRKSCLRSSPLHAGATAIFSLRLLRHRPSGFLPCRLKVPGRPSLGARGRSSGACVFFLRSRKSFREKRVGLKGGESRFVQGRGGVADVLEKFAKAGA